MYNAIKRAGFFSAVKFSVQAAGAATYVHVSTLALLMT